MTSPDLNNPFRPVSIFDAIDVQAGDEIAIQTQPGCAPTVVLDSTVATITSWKWTTVTAVRVVDDVIVLWLGDDVQVILPADTSLEVVEATTPEAQS